MTRHLVFLAFPGFQIVDLGALAVFELANLQPGGPFYEIRVLSEQGGLVPSSVGVPVQTEAIASRRSRAIDTLVVFGGTDDLPPAPGLVRYLEEASLHARRTASICTGAVLLAAAGLLDGRRATTHWHLAAELQRRYPALRVEQDRIYINDGKYWTSAGMTACIDLALALVEQDLGADAARTVARKMVVYHRRSGGQSQFSAMLDLDPTSDRIRKALDYARRNLRKPLSVDELADVANLSRRQFSRSFRLETGQTPAKAVETLRVEAARAMLESAGHPVEVVARESGFEDAERMRRAFIRAFGHPPQALRRQSRERRAAA
ncbi:GlxA family transcriptional regulator [Massilia niastensis]|uniref:GlxA family transcriptional regulator n=1 Tax=Massilia niastensis TaxID=544911 RepID=UPI00037CFD08|nr:GlxA family transcriptional regulator [Massilia niastensis]